MSASQEEVGVSERQKPKDRVSRPAVGWLLGPELISELRKILSSRQDPRSWMACFPGFLHDEARFRDGRLIEKIAADGARVRPASPSGIIAITAVAEDTAAAAIAGVAAQVIDKTSDATLAATAVGAAIGATAVSTAVGKAAADVLVAGEVASIESARVGADCETARYPAEVDSIWFDYIADTGDSNDATYAIAYACQLDLQLDLQPDAQGQPLLRPLPGQESPSVPGKGLEVRAWRHADHQKDPSRRGNLPRGQFLFIGGDTAYHVADKLTVRDRLIEPFQWAHQDLEKDLLPIPDLPKPRLYGIPGNHDWYDDLDGFSFAFRRDETEEAFALSGFQRVQLASYTALQLPHGWQLWGLDIDGGIDARQLRYFSSLGPSQPTPRAANAAEAPSPPARLILCTPVPSIVYDKVMATRYHREALPKLNLPEAYNPGPEHTLPPGACRLDLAGDTHHYARYVEVRQPEQAARSASPPAASPPTAPASPRDSRLGHYMSVVAGLGGAFHHPSFVRIGDRPAAVKYPDEDASRNALAAGLLRPLSTLIGSWIRAFPIIITLVMAAGITAGGGASWLWQRVFHAIPGLAGLQDNPGVRAELGKSALLLLVLAAAAVALWGAAKVFGIARRKQLEQPGRRRSLRTASFDFKPGGWFDPWRSQSLSTSLIVVGIALPILFSISAYAPAAASAGPDAGTLALLLVAVLAGPWLAGWVGGSMLPASRKPPLVLLGLVHGIAQMITPLCCALYFTSSWRAVAVGVIVLVATWILLQASRPLFRRKSALGVSLLALLAWLAGLAALLWAAGGNAIPLDQPWYCQLLRFLGGAALAVLLGTTYVAWYFAIAALLGAHNDEAGGTARITKFRQLIRFHLDEKGLTGYVISVEDGALREDGEHGKKGERPSPVTSGGEHLVFTLRDVFTISPPPPP